MVRSRPGAARDLDGLRGVWEPDPGDDGDDFDGAVRNPAAAAVGVAVTDRDIGPGLGGERPAKVRLVVLHGEQEMRPALGDAVVGVPDRTCNASAVTTAPDSLMVSRSGAKMGSR